MKKSRIFLPAISFLAILIASFCYKTALAADIFIVPDSTQISKDQIIGATVYISSPNTSVNNAESVISFPSNILNVISIDQSNSIFNLWVEPPTFSNVYGTISFNGGIPNPGFSNNYGVLFRITFKAINVGSAPIVFSSATIRANDGLGTDVTKSKTNGVITVIATEKPETIYAKNVPNAPEIYSTDIPVQTKWYPVKKAVLSWTLSEDVTAIQTSFGQDPDAIPTNLSTELISKKQLTNLSDGIWYFNLRLRNNIGWSPTTHYQIKIDSTLPDSLELAASTTADNLIQISFKGHDSLSGISSYTLYLDDNKISTVDDTSEKLLYHIFPPTVSGTHKITVQAYDQAGNFIEKKTSISLSKNGMRSEYLSIDVLIVFVMLGTLLVIIAILGVAIGNMRYNALKKKAAKDLDDAEKKMHYEFTSIHETIAIHINDLKKAGKTRELTEEETQILKNLSKTLTDIESALDKKLEDIRRTDL